MENIPAGNYTLTVTDSNGCEQSISVEITQTDEMEISETYSDYTGYGVSCFGETDGEIDVTVNGGTGNYTYTWSNGETTEDLNGIGAGTYNVIVADENGCSIETSVEITEPEGMVLSETHSNYTGYGVSCFGEADGAIDVTVSGGSGGYTYLWSSGQITEDLDNIPAGNYTLTVTDSNGCELSISCLLYTSDAADE